MKTHLQRLNELSDFTRENISVPIGNILFPIVDKLIAKLNVDSETVLYSLTISFLKFPMLGLIDIDFAIYAEIVTAIISPICMMTTSCKYERGFFFGFGLFPQILFTLASIYHIKK